MKINKKKLKFERDNLFIRNTFEDILKNFKCNKLRKNDNIYVYDNISMFIILSKIENSYELMINGIMYDNTVSISFFKKESRFDLLKEYYIKLSSLYREELLCEKYKKQNI